MNSKWIGLVPKFIRKWILGMNTKLMIGHFKRVIGKIPKYELTNKQISNTKLILNREELLKILPREAVVAEIGVDEGGFSEKILDICAPKKFHLVDFWGSKRYNQNKRKLVEDKFSQEIKENRIEINLGLSTDAVHDFEDNYFDWIYIDTDHTYSTTIAELETYAPKLKENGIIAGHDYITGSWISMIKYGVIEAVYEFCTKNDWEILYVTTENEGYPSFAIRKISF